MAKEMICIKHNSYLRHPDELVNGGCQGCLDEALAELCSIKASEETCTAFFNYVNEKHPDFTAGILDELGWGNNG
jgi:hypothetical protein